MAEDGGEIPVTLKEVRERFEASAETLASARLRLEELATAASSSTEATTSLNRASAEIVEFAEASRSAVEVLQEAQREASGSFSALGRLVEESDLKAVGDGVTGVEEILRDPETGQATVSTDVKTVLEGINKLNETLEKRVGELDSELKSARSELDDVRTKFDRLFAVASGRTRKKAGLE